MITKQERTEAIERLRGWLKPGDIVNCVLRHKSRSGMQRRISFLRIEGDSVLILDRNICKALDMHERDRLEGVIVNGCGMDMGFHVVSSLSATLYPDGFGCIGKGCPSNDHSNGDRDYAPHVPEVIRGSDGALVFAAHQHWHKSGDYALRHRWL